MFYIRGDANSEIGSGHIMRCLAIAKSLKKRGEDTTFITADREAEKLITGNGFSMINLDTTWNNLEYEMEKLAGVIQKIGIEKLMVDSYSVTDRYMQFLSDLTKVIYMDDLNESIYPLDMLINYSISADKQDYEKKYESTKILIGTRYIPLREEFAGIKRIHKVKVKDILITTGGSDSYNMSGELIKYIRKFSFLTDWKLHIVVGTFNVHKDELYKLEKEFHNIFLYENISHISELMCKCDIAISAGGTTLYELCACGIPSICFTFADNQIRGIEEFNRQGLIYYAGDIRNDMNKSLDLIIKELKALDNDYNRRGNLSIRMMDLVDGQGADRIAGEILML
ncbi:UDP-2,4-diacetamido-2,4,6-trideoxy-beta-L-altropyranose hydrolase [Anaerocolumna sp. MB42-C2]|uniref:UDP-2,4-diacetamido-2,4, 6-trideoxy-beta-L-altropyranose hydrolase n=1 Tax=Anaerocolumna sp. MB42-C2 TaxID=3070997 RepID=UPI0027DF9125|nr:UDP-2,4-diacetamido-2,4,6-trideoxy-beta-L-altropyranose hydrolase [Anaerocolumna sp. MB42-C2]WMJ90215.1 UDP-2,4-diacetamido-2,4,6-trideoxy-beta-L-altropyranose hydrolase [Anaerocolumna sp. MB42-C2]